MKLRSISRKFLMPRITVQHLEYLVALVAERHVTRAAERVGIGQPAMSAALAKLRAVFKDPLLVKTSSGMVPTQRAIELARRARESIDLLMGGRSTEFFEPATAEGHLRLMASEGITTVLMPGFMARMSKLAPNLIFTVSPGDVRRAGDLLRDGELELALGFFRQPPLDLHQTSLYTQELVCIARLNHPHVRGELTLEQFLASGHVVWGAPPVPYPTLEMLVEEALEQLNASRRVVLRVASVNSSTAIVAGTDLLAVVPLYVARSASMRERFQVLRLPFSVGQMAVTMLWHDRWHHDPLHAWVRKVISDVSRSLRMAGADFHAVGDNQ